LRPVRFLAGSLEEWVRLGGPDPTPNLVADAGFDTVVGLETRYADLRLGLADCSLVILADRYQTDRILSFDERHFRSVTSLAGAPFVVLPADAAAHSSR
jgi:hypothetical protein